MAKKITIYLWKNSWPNLVKAPQRTCGYLMTNDSSLRAQQIQTRGNFFYIFGNKNDVWFIYNGSWTEWSTIWAGIIRVISKSNERAAQVRFEITNMIPYQNCTTRGSITTLLHPFWNCPNTGLGQFKHFIDAVMSRSEIKFMSFFFFWGGGGSKS